MYFFRGVLFFILKLSVRDFFRPPPLSAAPLLDMLGTRGLCSVAVALSSAPANMEPLVLATTAGSAIPTLTVLCCLSSYHGHQAPQGQLTVLAPC